LNIYLKEPEQKAKACVIWMHGLGADASDMAGLASELSLNGLPVRHVFIDAPTRPVTLNNGLVMRAWYDIVGLTLTDREDEVGIAQSEKIIRQIVDDQLKDGFSSDQIFLAGFSQGGAMALYTALQMESPLAGVIVLSGYLPLASKSQTTMPQNTPVFIAGGQYDPIVLPMWTALAVEWLKQSGYKAVSLHTYLMEHTICMDELNDLSIWLTNQVRSA
jgi:phospholipase/carboxylesterase